MRRNDCLTAVTEELRAVGIVPKVVHGGRHLQTRWHSRTGHTRVLTISGTPGDRRSATNARAQVRRLLRSDGYLVNGDPALQQPARELSRIERLEQRVTILEQKLGGR